MEFPMTPEQAATLAELDRRMDAGEQPFVLTPSGARLAVSTPTLTLCGLDSGVKVSPQQLHAVMLAKLAEMQAISAYANETCARLAPFR